MIKWADLLLVLRPDNILLLNELPRLKRRQIGRFMFLALVSHAISVSFLFVLRFGLQKLLSGILLMKIRSEVGTYIPKSRKHINVSFFTVGVSLPSQFILLSQNFLSFSLLSFLLYLLLYLVLVSFPSQDQLHRLLVGDFGQFWSPFFLKSKSTDPVLHLLLLG